MLFFLVVTDRKTVVSGLLLLANEFVELKTYGHHYPHFNFIVGKSPLKNALGLAFGQSIGFGTSQTCGGPQLFQDLIHKVENSKTNPLQTSSCNFGAAHAREGSRRETGDVKQEPPVLSRT